MPFDLTHNCPTALDAGQQTSAQIVPSPHPHLSWRLPAGMTAQHGYELEARIGSEMVVSQSETSQHRMIAWPWTDLPSRTGVQWRVRVRGANGRSGWSDWSAFETPLFGADDWLSEWISPTEEAEIPEDRPAYTLSREFTLDAAPGAARLYATALGVYEVFLNGERVGDLELAPGSSNYDETVYAQAYDVTMALNAGKNRIEIVLSDGWFRGRNGGMQRQDAWGKRTAALAQLEITTVDDAMLVICTDSTWASHAGVITRADLMTGQTTDFSRADTASAPVVVGAVSPPVPTWSPAPAPKRIEELKPVSVTAIAPDTSVVDFGQNISGWVRLTNLGKVGSETILEFGEHIDAAGDLTTAHLDIHTPEGAHIPYRQVDRVIAGPASSVFEPRHTVHGFQYARIQHPGRTLAAEDVRAVVVHSDLTPTSWFSCSNEQLNQLHDAARWSFRGNIVDVPTDCPTRERSGWTGDFQVFAPAAALLYDIDGFTRKWLQAVRDDQYDDGSLAMFSPDSERMKHTPENPARAGGGSAGWGDAAVYVPWTLYENYGDTAILTESWDSMRAWVEFALSTARAHRHPSRTTRSSQPAPHEQFIWDGSFHFGEWLEPKKRREDGTLIDPMVDAPMVFLTADKGEVATAYLYRSTLLLSRAALILGKTVDATRYAELAERIRLAWQAEFLTAETRTIQDTQAAYVRALAFDLIPHGQRGAAGQRLIELIDDADGRLTTGFLSTGMLLPVLADAGHLEAAFGLLLQEDSPSWLGMLGRGATTVWEDWDGIDEKGHASASLNHYSKGAVIRFLYSHVAGLQQAQGSTAWKHFEVRPMLGGGITTATAQFLSPQGLIEVGWRLNGSAFAMEVTVPAGSTATAVLPDGSSTAIGPGQHQFACVYRPQDIFSVAP
ncbi:family 78 glycoside hydrolase catalytic domain [Paenarthrobacter nitroguajacolicus]|uniref:family 78 glycoside hydrolase catalytic domain n=1 Tax=Paenarthrobacter nitroguajacolicus TaxID=211146 RepID=UPI004054381E